MKSRLRTIFEECYRELRPRAPLPEFQVEFFPFANLNHTIRLRQGRVRARVSDLLKRAPEPVLRAVAHLLLAKLYRRPQEPGHLLCYRQHAATPAMHARTQRLRRERGRKALGPARGRVYDLEQIFTRLNRRYFAETLPRPRLSWSRDEARARLGHYDPAHHVLVISRALDRPEVPPGVVDYLVFHEMLHLKHPVEVRRGRRRVHSAAFRAEERGFPGRGQAERFLRGWARGRRSP